MSEVGSVLGWDHLHLRSPDPAETAGFFVALLGAREVGRAVGEGSLRVTLDLAGMTLLIDRSAPEALAPPSGDVHGFAHIGLRTDGVDALVERLRERGVEIVVAPKDVRPGLRVAFVRGPQGLVIEFLERDRSP